MATGLLTDTKVRQTRLADKPNGHKLTDGDGLYLYVTRTSKLWRMDYRYLGSRKTLSIGMYPAVSLAEARKRRDKARGLLAQDPPVDPSTAKRQAQIARIAAVANTFEAVARDWLAKTAANRKPSTQTKISRWIEKTIVPTIGKKPIASITPADLRAVLDKFAVRGSIETAHRVLWLCKVILEYAKAKGLIEHADAYVGLNKTLPSKKEKHHAAITDPAQLGGLLRAIHAYRGHPTTEAALKLAPLVFVRPGELRTAEWTEIDLDTAEWRIPGAKMKMGEDHIVPLSRQAVEILRALHQHTGNGRFVFPSVRGQGQCMSNNTLNAALRGMGYGHEVHTAHGFRATARTILDEVLGERMDLIEHQLAHAVRDVNGRAYNRTAHLPARRAMMQRWADYLDRLRVGANVVPIRKSA